MKQNIEKKLFYEKIISLSFLQAFSEKIPKLGLKKLF